MKKINLSRFTLRLFNHLPAAEKRITIPTFFTLLRIIVIPIIIAAMIKARWDIAFFFFAFACMTDLVDGFLARLLDAKTFLGACLDPIADKLLLLSCFLTLVFISTPFSIPQSFVLFIVAKELLQLTGAVVIYWMQGHLDVKPTMLGKTTTCIQMIFILWLFASYFFRWIPVTVYYSMLIIMTGFISASFLQYVRIGLRICHNKNGKK
jgi:cardiolipin synthase (CMP-forming)